MCKYNPMNPGRHSKLCFILAWHAPQFQRRTAGGGDVCLPCGGGGRPGAADSRCRAATRLRLTSGTRVFIFIIPFIGAAESGF